MHVPWPCGTAVAALALTLTGCVVQAPVEGPPPGTDGAEAYQDLVADDTDAEVAANEAPPPLPDYDQPPCPEDGYLWTPGYWGWSGGAYFWVPGTWVLPPQVGFLWTPGYWGFVGGAYRFHGGYWGPHVGFYGGVNYGFGYTGHGFVGGAWQGNHYAYNRAVTNVNVTVVHNTYNTTVVNYGRGNRVSYNGGAGGIGVGPTQQDRQFAHESHVTATPVQQQHTQQAAQNPALFARANGGHPPIAATPRPAAFNGPGVEGARGAGPRGPQGEPQPQYQGRGQYQYHQPNQPPPAAQAPVPVQKSVPVPAPRPAKNPEPNPEHEKAQPKNRDKDDVGH